MLDRIQRIEEYVADDRQKFLSDPLTQDAVLRNLELIGASAKRLSDEAQQLASEIPWRRIAGLRDVLAHDYINVQPARVLEILDRDLRDLKTALKKIAAEL